MISVVVADYTAFPMLMSLTGFSLKRAPHSFDLCGLNSTCISLNIFEGMP